MSNYNRVILMGNITYEPQLKYLPSKTAVCEFGMAINRRYKTADGAEKEEVCFVDCSAFGKMGETINNFMAKGKPIHVEGRLSFSSWEDKQGGGKRSKLSVIVENFQFVGRKEGSGDEGGESQPPQRQPSRAGGGSRPRQTVPPYTDEGINPDDVPFAFEWHRTPI